MSEARLISLQKALLSLHIHKGTVVVVMQIAPLASDAASLRAPGFLTVTSSGYEGLRFSLREDSKEAVILRDVIYVRETAETMISIQERYGQGE